MFQDILRYPWERRTTALGYVVTALGIMATSDLFTATQVKWFLLINGILMAILGHYNNSKIQSAAVPKSQQGGFARPLMIAFLLAVAVPVSLVLPACTSSPVKEAETFEQKAFALYGTYVIFQAKAAEMTQDSTTPEKVKQALRDADKAAYPVAEALVDAAIEIGSIRDTLNQCPLQPEPDPQCVPTNEQRLANAITNLSSIYFSAQPKLLAVVAAVKESK